jgi:hypothetical protein
MAYDKSKDKVLWETTFDHGSNNSILCLSVCQYNGGDKKVQITRKVERNGKISFSKMGRLNDEEYAFLVKSWEKVREIMG